VAQELLLGGLVVVSWLVVWPGTRWMEC